MLCAVCVCHAFSWQPNHRAGQPQELARMRASGRVEPRVRSSGSALILHAEAGAEYVTLSAAVEYAIS